MSPINVLVIFYSRSGATEKLALAAAVGAVQARANIRMRRLPDSSEESSPGNEALVRMRREYVPPTKTDALWADAIIIGLHGKICGAAVDAGGATNYGRKITVDTRTLKDAIES